MDFLSFLLLLLVIFMFFIFINLSIINLNDIQDSIKNFKFKKIQTINEGFSYDNKLPLFIQSHPEINNLSSRIPSTNELINNRVFDPKPNMRF